MSEFPYAATVVVPVYNVEKYVAGCIDSLVGQSIGFSKIEVIIVNDGSTDSSESICKEYSEKYENIKLFSKENGGLSSTRNYALNLARGKYIFYLDSDDKLAPETIEAVTEFFDSVYNEVDLVTYRITQYFHGRPVITHFRYKTLKKSGVYDLTLPENRFITQTNINICVKNLGENNLKFDTAPDFKHEDEKYCCEMLEPKMKIGFCSHGEYIYNRNNVDSIVSTQFSPEKIFESSMRFYEELFGKYKYKVPPYFQGIVFNDFRWKLMDNKFLPIHYQGEMWEKANERINELLIRMDNDTIILHPSINENHMHYWLGRKKNSFPTVISKDDRVEIFVDGRIIFSATKFNALLCSDKSRCYINSPIFNYLNPSRYSIIVETDGLDKEVTDIAMSDYSVKSSDRIILPFPEFQISAKPDSDIKIRLRIDTNEYKVIVKNKE
jgi:glycosyltransferase involved in cell wall biosynthesis